MEAERWNVVNRGVRLILCGRACFVVLLLTTPPSPFVIPFQEITAPVKSTGMGDLLKSLLTLEPKARATATEALRHRFFAEDL